MKILIACIPTPGNRYLIDLKQGLEQHAEVIWDYHAFWKCKDVFDVIHIHWPEYLSYDIETYLYNDQTISKILWNKLRECLEYWSKNAKIIYTRHNTLPHVRQDNDFKKLYELIGRYAQTMVHFANYSIKQFKKWYPDLSHIKHVVIPHHNYASLPNLSTRTEARTYLNIAADAHVMLVFGAVKENEKALIKKAFKAIPYKNKVLLAPGWKILRRKIGYIRLREWVWKLEKWWASENKSFRTHLGFIKEEEAHYYLNAADFLFIPRTSELNSGNISLGFTFGLVVVGKDDGDVGEILKETGNPSFTVGDEDSLKKAIADAYQLKAQQHGTNNKDLAMNEWNIQNIAKAYWEVMAK